MPTERRQKEIAALHRKKTREELGQFVIEGARSLESALRGGAQLHEVLLARTAELDPILLRRLAAAGIEPGELSDRMAARLAHTATPPGILAVAAIPEGSVSGAKRVLVLDGVQDPGNVGTLIRTAAWFGVDAVVCGPGTADPFAPKTVRATMGGIWDVAIVRSDDLAESLRACRDDGFGIWAADMDGTDSRDWHPGARSVLMIGSEAHGISTELGSMIDGRVSIGRAGASAGAGHPGAKAAATSEGRRADGAAIRPPAVESLNAAVAGGILMATWTG